MYCIGMYVWRHIGVGPSENSHHHLKVLFTASHWPRAPLYPSPPSFIFRFSLLLSCPLNPLPPPTFYAPLFSYFWNGFQPPFLSLYLSPSWCGYQFPNPDPSGRFRLSFIGLAWLPLFKRFKGTGPWRSLTLSIQTESTENKIWRIPYYLTGA